MAGQTTDKRYGKVAMILHWVIALAIIGQLAGGKFFTSLSFATHSELRISLTQTHKAIGLTVLALSVFRLIWRLTHKAPALPGGMSAFERLAAKFTHVVFYGLIIGLPVTGWLMVSPYKNDISFFGLFNWPKVPGVEGNNQLGEVMNTSHEYLGYFTIAMIALHIAAALKHHFVNKDDVLARMVPIVKPKSKEI